MLLLENVSRLSKPNIMASVTTALFHLPCGGLELGKYFDRGCVKMPTGLSVGFPGQREFPKAVLF